MSAGAEIYRLFQPEEGKPSTRQNLLRAFDNADGSLATRLCELVRAEVLAHSEPIGQN
jgi:hypothetical protein